MRIGIYDPYLDDLGGGEKYMMAIAECLSQSHNVTVFWDNNEGLKKIEKRFSVDLGKVKIEKNIFSSKVSLIKRLLVTKNYDAIIMLIDGSIPTVSSGKLFLHIQQPLSSISSKSFKSRLKLSRVTGIFYNSKFTKSYNDKVFAHVKSSVIYPPVNIAAKKLAKENIIMHVGRFRVISVNNQDYKKQQVMVGAFKEMMDEGLKGWKFVVVTSINDENETRFKEMLNSTKGYPIEFLVNKSNQELWETYNKAKIYWHASGFGEDLSVHPEYAEHFGISTVEAMGVGVVPVVINAGGQKEIVTDGENGLFWGTFDEFKKITIKLIDDKKLWQRLSDKAKVRAKDFNYERFCEDINMLLES